MASPSPARPGGAWFLADRVIGMTAGSSEVDHGLLLAVPVSEIAAFLYGADGALAALP